jgi:hypothetical protein
MAVISRVSALALAFAGLCSAVEKRDLKAIDASYDYVVVGGGVSGLVVANRLTEDSNSTFRFVVVELQTNDALRLQSWATDSMADILLLQRPSL